MRRSLAGAAGYGLEQARAAGLAETHMLSFPAGGTVFYGAQRSRRGWDADFAELWEQRRQPASRRAKA